MDSTPEAYAQAAVQARREGRGEDARQHAEQAVALCREQGLREKLARALMLVGQVMRDAGQPAAALKPYEEAAGISREVDSSLRYAHTLRHLADLHCDLGELDLAEKAYTEALGIYRSEPNPNPCDLANAVRAYAVLKDAAGAAEAARPLWQEARGLYEKLGIEEGVEECDARLRA